MIRQPAKVREDLHELAAQAATFLALYGEVHSSCDLHARGTNEYGANDPTPASATDPQARHLRSALKRAAKSLRAATRELERANRALRGAWGTGRPEVTWRQHDVLDGTHVATNELERLRTQRDERLGPVAAREARGREDSHSLNPEPIT